MRKSRQLRDRTLAFRRMRRRSAIRKMLLEAAQDWPQQIRLRRQAGLKPMDMSQARQGWARRAKRWQAPSLLRLANRMMRV